MAHRYTEKVDRIIYMMDLEEVKRRILDSMRDEVGEVFDDSTVVTILPDGQCTIVSEYVQDATP